MIANLPSQTMFFLVGLQPVTLTFVYVGTTIKDIADISHSGRHFTRARLVSCIIATLTTLYSQYVTMVELQLPSVMVP